MAKRSRMDSTASNTSPLSSSHDDSGPKYAHVEDEQDAKDRSLAMQCYLPPHAPMSFTTYDDYESHYQQYHAYRCSSCHKNLPSDHFLNLHIRENHDSLTAAQKARGDKIYLCFVEGCDKTCSTPQKRRMHLVDKHHFPRDYNFFVVNDGLDKRRSMLRPNPKPRAGPLAANKKAGVSSAVAHAQSDALEDAEFTPDADVASKPPVPKPKSETRDGAVSDASVNGADENMDDLTRSMSALRFVPSSVRFGRGKTFGFAKR